MAATDVDLVQKVIMEMGSNVTGSHVVRILASKVGITHSGISSVNRSTFNFKR